MVFLSFLACETMVDYSPVRLLPLAWESPERCNLFGLLGNFQRCLQCGSENSLISYGIFSVNTLRRAVRLPFGGGCPCRLLTRITPPYFFPFGRWVAGRSFPFSKALLHGAVGYKVFPINTLAAKREEDLSGNGAAARPFSRHKAPCLLCLCKRK